MNLISNTYHYNEPMLVSNTIRFSESNGKSKQQQLMNLEWGVTQECQVNQYL